MNAISVINLFPDKEKIGDYAEKVKAEILDGKYNVCDFFAQLKCVEKATEILLGDPELKDFLKKEFLNDKKFTHNGVSFTLVETKRYEVMSDRSFELEAQIKALKEELKKEQARWKLDNEPDYVEQSIRISL
jgi:hypothetical protein